MYIVKGVPKKVSLSKFNTFLFLLSFLGIKGQSAEILDLENGHFEAFAYKTVIPLDLKMTKETKIVLNLLRDTFLGDALYNF